MKKDLSWYAGCEFDNEILIVGAGGMLRENYSAVGEWVCENHPTIIGVNKMTDFFIPDYHLWTNEQRYQEQRNCIRPESEMIFGKGLMQKMPYYVGDYIEVDYGSHPGNKYAFKGGKLYGHYRTAGVLAIAVANVLNLGSRHIYVVGMDGFTLYDEKELKDGKGNHHCYGKGYTDDATYEECKFKDDLVLDGLRKLSTFGINFSIITPTVFNEFYENRIGI